MVKSELIKHLVSKQTNLSNEDVVFGVNTIIEQLSQSLVKNERIEIRGFGRFELRYRRARQAHNPRTGEGVMTIEKYTTHFKPGKELRDRINAARFKYPIQNSR